MHVCGSPQHQLLLGGCVSDGCFLHMYRCASCVLCLLTSFLSTCPLLSSKRRFAFCLPRICFTQILYCIVPLLPPFASVTCMVALTHKMKREATGPKHEPPRDVGGASNCVSAHRGNPFPRGIVSLICCGEMPKREKISPTFMPDFLLPTWSECTKKEPLNVHYPPSTLGEAIRKLSFCSR